MKKTSMPFKKKKTMTMPSKKMKKKTTTTSKDASVGSNLPLDIVTHHVLSFLPVKALCRLKCVCTSWKRRISSDEFSKTHLHMTNTTNQPQKTLLISTSDDALYSVDFADENPTPRNLDYPFLKHSRKWIEVSGSCNGLVLITDESNSNILFNPSTSECRKLPQSNFLDHCSEDGDQYILRGLGYDSSADNYKVVMICYRELLGKVAVYSLETDSWGIVQVTRHDYPLIVNGFYFNDCLHWLCFRRSPKIVVAFDVSREIQREVQLPASLENYELTTFSGHYMAVLGGSLCLILPFPNNGTEVWMMKKYGVRDSWTKIANTGMSIEHVYCLLGEDEGVLKRYEIAEVDGEIVDCFDGDKLVLYNLKKETFRVVMVSGIRTKYTITQNYIETLVSPKSRRTDLETM